MLLGGNLGCLVVMGKGGDGVSIGGDVVADAGRGLTESGADGQGVGVLL